MPRNLSTPVIDRDDLVGARLPWTRFSAICEVTFLAAGAVTIVAHQLGEEPTDRIVLRGSIAVKDAPGKTWDKTFAYLQADAAGVARVVFLVAREAAINARR